MQKIVSALLLIGSVSFSSSAIAEDLDFSLPSDNDFFAMKDQVRTMDDTSKDAYRSERQSRMMNMDQSERDSRFADMGASGKRNMDENSQRKGSGKRDGSGSGKQKRKGQGNQSEGDQSGGNQYRYGQSNNSSSSSGSGGGRRYGGGGGRHQ